MMSDHSDLAFEIPSKTFVIGEYLAIKGTASLIAATEPSFFVKVIDDKRYGYHPDSPAGRLLKKLKLGHHGYSFFDPHEGRGGFGRSTAEFLSVYIHDQMENKKQSDVSRNILDNLEDFIQLYRESCGNTYQPSGADLVAQVCGGLCWYDGMNFHAERLAWPFPGYELSIFHTGKKLATHEHLKDLKNLSFQSLIPILIAARTAMEQKNLRVFCESINYYYDILNEMGLSEKNVRESVEKLKEKPEVLAAKGCGAMGVDTVLVVSQKSDQEKIKNYCFNEDFQYISDLSQAHSGVTTRRPL